MNARLSHRIVIALAFLLSTSCTQAVNKAAKSEAQHGADTTQAAPASKWQPTAQQEVVKVKSAAMGEVSNTVTVPASYLAASDTTHYPVVYLLHGFGDDHTEWAKQADLKAAANRYGIIIVCPDGKTSWYFDSPVNPKLRYETYISSELVQWVDSHYRTRAHRMGRAITGLSMGGHGALWNAFRHPDVWGSCGSMSGGVDITKFTDRWHIKARLGNYEDNPERWHQHAVVNLVPSIQPGQNIIIDDGADDFFYEVNCNLHEALLKAKIPHDFTIRPGAHSWKYWINALDYHMLFFSKAFSK